MKKIIIEDKVPFLDGVFETVAEVVRLKAKEITKASLNDADALITRTRPMLDEHILKGTKLKVIATATIGTDHIDLNYCRSRNIRVVNAPGCNAPAVAQWVFASIFNMIGDLNPKDSTIGIIGVGHVGQIVREWARYLGFKVLLNDPPRANNERGSEKFYPIEQIAAEADIITFHVPLNIEGEYPTKHMADASFFSRLLNRPYFLNASRGAVVDGCALKAAIRDGKLRGVAIDVWENEPAPDPELIMMADVSTPHIAGYSIEGKMRASYTAAKEVAKELGLQIELPFHYPEVFKDNITKSDILSSYDIVSDSRSLKGAPGEFESLRDNYLLRHEPKA